MILLIDNYDSFVHNLARYFRRLGQLTRVVRNDQLDVAGIRKLSPAIVVLSPGPCGPDQAGVCLAAVRELAGQTPILGICLGHQVIGQAFGGRIVRAPLPMHGRASWLRHDGEQEFAAVPNPLLVGRYHSLVIDETSLPECLRVTARSEDGVIMAIQHKRYAITGWQFHPESVLTPDGYSLLAAYLAQLGLRAATAGVPLDDTRNARNHLPYHSWFTRPIEPFGSES